MAIVWKPLFNVFCFWGPTKKGPKPDHPLQSNFQGLPRPSVPWEPYSGRLISILSGGPIVSEGSVFQESATLTQYSTANKNATKDDRALILVKLFTSLYPGVHSFRLQGPYYHAHKKGTAILRAFHIGVTLDPSSYEKVPLTHTNKRLWQRPP